MSFTTLTTPVAFLIFNRPNTTQQVFEEIRRARPTKLLVVADGPRPDKEGEAEKCQAVRNIIDTVDWPCEVLKNYSDVNLGCKIRVSSGLDWVFEQVEEAIILEDDCLPNQFFFGFCQEMLQRYRDDTRVMMITGTNPLIETKNASESYCFSRYFSIWGWATWRRAWKLYDIEMSNWPRLKSEGQLCNVYTKRYAQRAIKTMFDVAYNKCIDTWDIQWAYSCLFNNGLCLVPKLNLISNIGLVGTHTTKGDTSNHLRQTFSLDIEAIIHPDMVYADVHFDQALLKKNFQTNFKMLFKNKFISICNHLKQSIPT